MNDNPQKNTKKQTVIAIIIAIAVSLIVIISSLIYGYFFKDNIAKEENQKIFNEQMEQVLEKDKAAAEDAVKNAKEIIAKYNLDIYGQYVSVYNEIVESADVESQSGTTTQAVTTAMMVNDDMTLNFSDGKIGWWSLEESPEGIVHMGVAKDGAQSIEMLMVCDNTLIDVGKAIFFGKLPNEATFDGEFKAGNLTLEFKKDGTVNGEYNEIIKEDGEEFPWTEVYRGEYRRSGEYMDIILNGSGARYLTFNVETNDPEKPVSGFAAKYYIKSENQ